MNQEALHIISGASAAGALKQAHELHSEQILVSYDPLACGPVPATTDIAKWRSVRQAYWSSIHVDYAGGLNVDNDLHGNLDRLDTHMPIVLWAASGLADQLLLAWLHYYFATCRIDTSNLAIVQVEFLHPRPGTTQHVQSMGQLSPEKIKTALAPPRKATTAESSQYSDAWRAYTSSDPQDLCNYLMAGPGPAVLHNAMQRLVYRYPSDKTGLCACDEELLRQVASNGPRATRIIAYTIGELMDTGEFLGDSVLFHRLKQMADEALVAPLVSVSGDSRELHTCDVELTDIGEQVLAGEANAVQVNEADDWIGGVHIAGAWPVPHRHGDALIIPA